MLPCSAKGWCLAPCLHTSGTAPCFVSQDHTLPLIAEVCFLTKYNLSPPSAAGIKIARGKLSALAPHAWLHASHWLRQRCWEGMTYWAAVVHCWARCAPCAVFHPAWRHPGSFKSWCSPGAGAQSTPRGPAVTAGDQRVPPSL